MHAAQKNSTYLTASVLQVRRGRTHTHFTFFFFSFFFSLGVAEDCAGCRMDGKRLTPPPPPPVDFVKVTQMLSSKSSRFTFTKTAKTATF